VAAYASAYRPTFPPTFEPKGIEFGVALTQILIDTPRSPLTDAEVTVEPLAAKADLYARLVESEPVQESIAEAGGFDLGQVAIASRISGSATFSRAGREQVGAQRAQDIASERQGRQILFAAEQGVPVLTVFAQAPTAEEAVRLAQAGARGLIGYISSIQVRRATPRASRIQLSQLGSARGGTVNPGASRSLALVVFLAVFGGWCLLLLVGDRLVAQLRSRAAKCTKCGEPVPAGASFCANCGTPVTGAPAAAPGSRSEPVADNRQSGSAASA